MKKKTGPPTPSPRKPFGDKPAPRYHDKPPGRFGDKPADRSGDKPADRFSDKPAGRSGDKPSGRFGDKPTGRAGDKPQGRFGDKPAGRFGDKPPGRFGDKPAGRFGNKPAGRFGDKPAGRFGDTSEGRRGDKPSQTFGDKPTGRHADSSAGRFVEKPGGRFGRSEGKTGGRFDEKFARSGDKPLGRPFGRAKSSEDPQAGGPFKKQAEEGRPARKSYAARPFTPHEERSLAKRTSRARPNRDFEEPLYRDEQRTKGKAAGRKLELDFDDLIYGVHAIEEAMRGGEELLSLHIGVGRDRDPLVAALIQAAERLGIPICFEKPDYFANIPYKAHQSLIAIGKPFDYVSLEDAMANRPVGGRLLVVLDHLTDPHNVGAILRTAECAGAQAAILPDRRSAGVNATVRKVAAGAASHLPIAKVGNLAQTIRTLKENGFTVIGAALGPEAKDLSEVNMKGDVALVIGAEGEGLGRLVGRSCDVLTKIPLKGKVESLNASVAAGILLYEVVRQRRNDIS